MPARDFITYYLFRAEGKPLNGPFCTQILGGHLRHVTDEEVIEYVKKVHGVAPVKIVRTPWDELQKKRKRK